MPRHLIGLIVFLVVAFVAISFTGQLIQAAVAPLLPGIGASELHARVDMVLTCLTALGMLIWLRRKD